MAQDRHEREVPAQVLQYLREHKTVTVATASPSGVPHAATMIYASDGLMLYFCTRPEARTARNLAQNPQTSFTIDEYSPDWTQTKGIQGAGECRQLLEPQKIRQTVQLFRDKFSALPAARDDASSFNQLCFFCISPLAVEYIDNAEATSASTQALGMDYRRDLVYSVFRNLPRQDVDTLSAQLQTVEYGPGDIIVRQGAPADKFFIIVEGEVTVLRDEDKEPVPVATLRRGQFFGEIAILQDKPRSATVRAATPVTLLAMDRATFRALIAQSLSTTLDFDRVIQERLTALGRGSTP